MENHGESKLLAVEQEVGGSSPPNCTNKIKYLDGIWKLDPCSVHTLCTPAVNIRIFCSCATKAPAGIAKVNPVSACPIMPPIHEG
jgi:hypothetical protein